MHMKILQILGLVIIIVISFMFIGRNSILGNPDNLASASQSTVTDRAGNFFRAIFNSGVTTNTSKGGSTRAGDSTPVVRGSKGCHNPQACNWEPHTQLDGPCSFAVYELIAAGAGCNTGYSPKTYGDIPGLIEGVALTPTTQKCARVPGPTNPQGTKRYTARIHTWTLDTDNRTVLSNAVSDFGIVNLDDRGFNSFNKQSACRGKAALDAFNDANKKTTQSTASTKNEIVR
jgi:hypothetical protein